MRFIHIADVHLDTPFAGRSDELRQKLRAATRTAFRRAVDLAIHGQFDAMLIAGDLFDNDNLTLETEVFLIDEFKRLETGKVSVVYVAGNHDPGEGGDRRKSIPWPENVVVIATEEPREVEIRDADGQLKGRVVGAGHSTPLVSDDLSQRFPAPRDGIPTVGLLHTQVASSSGAAAHGRYAPSELQHLQELRYDYWALGHVHLRETLSTYPLICYSGIVQGRDFGETGPKGALLVDLSEVEHPAATFHELSPVRWERVEVDNLEEMTSGAMLLEHLERTWRGLRLDQADGTGFIVRFELKGQCPLHQQLSSHEELASLHDAIRDRLGLISAEVRVGKVTPPVNVERYLKRHDVLGETLRMIDEIRRGERTVALPPDRRMRIPDGLSTEEYVRSLLHGAEEELIMWMTREEEFEV